MSHSADALLFDIGNVLYGVDFNLAFQRWAGHASCDAALLRGRFAVDSHLKRYETGEIGSEEYFASLRTSLGISLSDEQFLDGWNAIFLDETPDISPVLARAAARLPLYAVSNSNHAHEQVWSKRYAGTLAHFRKIFVSSKIGVRKPDPAAFQLVVEEIGVPAARIVFFDDSLANIEGALACGLQAVHIRTPADVPAAIAAALR